MSSRKRNRDGSREPQDIKYYGLKIKNCVKNDQAEDIWTIYDEMIDEGINPNAIIMTEMVSAFGRHGTIKDLDYCGSEVRKHHVAVNIYLYTAFIDAYGKHDDEEEMMMYFNDMVEHKIPPNVITYTSLICFYSKHDDIKMVDRFYHEMQARKIPISFITYSILIGTYAKRHLFDEMLLCYIDMVKNRLRPTIQIYNVMTSAFEASDDIKSITLCYRDMKDFNIIPDVTIYNHFISVYARHDDVKNMKQCYCDMLEHKITPTTIIYNTLLGNRANTIDDAQLFLNDMVSKHVQLNTCTMSVLIDCCGYNNDSKGIEPIWIRCINEYKITPDEECYISKMQAYGKCELYTKAMEVYMQYSEQHHCTSHVGMTLILYNSILLPYFRSNYRPVPETCTYNINALLSLQNNVPTSEKIISASQQIIKLCMSYIR